MREQKWKRGRSDFLSEVKTFLYVLTQAFSFCSSTGHFNRALCAFLKVPKPVLVKMLSEQMLNLTTSSLDRTTPAPVAGGCPPVGIQLEGLILPPVLTVDVILGILGNVVSLWIFCFKVKAWNPNNLFLFNLVIADFLVLVSLPLRIDALLRRHWVFGDGMCRINLFLMFTNRSASIALMTVVAIHRYFKVRTSSPIFGCLINVPIKKYIE